MPEHSTQTGINNKGNWFTHVMKESSGTLGFKRVSTRENLGSDSGFLFVCFLGFFYDFLGSALLSEWAILKLLRGSKMGSASPDFIFAYHLIQNKTEIFPSLSHYRTALHLLYLDQTESTSGPVEWEAIH